MSPDQYAELEALKQDQKQTVTPKPIDSALVSPDAVARFHQKYERKQGSECFWWTGWCRPPGRAIVRIKQQQYYAARIAWFISTGNDPADWDVCHTCDNPKCVRPDHLFLGKHADNMRDAASKGRIRVARGVNRTTAKLTDAQVIAIRKEVARGGRPKAHIARALGVSPRLIHNIVQRLRWTHIP